MVDIEAKNAFVTGESLGDRMIRVGFERDQTIVFDLRQQPAGRLANAAEGSLGLTHDIPSSTHPHARTVTSSQAY
jgi:hypothetical protein